jgi:hypothetical protein
MNCNSNEQGHKWYMGQYLGIESKPYARTPHYVRTHELLTTSTLPSPLQMQHIFPFFLFFFFFSFFLTQMKEDSLQRENKPTLIRASSRARQQKQGGQSQDNYQLIERHEGGTKFHFTVRSNLLAIILCLVHLESKPERMFCFCSGGAEFKRAFVLDQSNLP